MKPTEIITADAERRGSDSSKELALVNQLIKNNNAILLQANNTVILLAAIGENKAELHLYTTDNPLKLMKSVIELEKKIKKSEIDFLYYQESNPQITEMLRRLDLIVEKSDLPNYDWMIDVRRK
jgi:hypothetical protein